VGFFFVSTKTQVHDNGTMAKLGMIQNKGASKAKPSVKVSVNKKNTS
jgi:hypothetical protein